LSWESKFLGCHPFRKVRLRIISFLFVFSFYKERNGKAEDFLQIRKRVMKKDDSSKLRGINVKYFVQKIDFQIITNKMKG